MDQNQINNFFDRYAARFTNAITIGEVDVERTAEAFANCFIEASPVGITCGKNKRKFRAAIPKGYEFYKSIGMTSMVILNKEITLLDNLHAMVKIHWKSSFIKKDNSPVDIEFAVIYFLQEQEGEYKIFAYITGDEQAALKEHGLV